jgi:perosamine synthetase
VDLRRFSGASGAQASVVIRQVCGALSIGGFLRGIAGWIANPRAHVWQQRLRSAFAQSIDVPEDTIWLFGAGRVALHALVKSLALKPGDEALLPGYTCVVVPNVFRHLGIPVRYVDIERGGFNPTPEDVSAAIGERTRAVVLPHNFGFLMRNVDWLMARHPTVVFIEDAAHAWGSRYSDGRAAGTKAQASFFSFEYSKCLTTGLGGALVINEPALRQTFAAGLRESGNGSTRVAAKAMLTLAWHLLQTIGPAAGLRVLNAISRRPARALGLIAQTPASELRGNVPPYYGAPLHDLCAAVGFGQVLAAERIWAQRVEQTQTYLELLKGCTRAYVPTPAEGEVLLRFPLVLDDAGSREATIEAMAALGIELGVWFNDVVHPKGSARYGYAAIVNLPLGIHADLNDRQRAALRAWAAA